jgi:hypothetical protein
MYRNSQKKHLIKEERVWPMLYFIARRMPIFILITYFLEERRFLLWLKHRGIRAKNI